MIKFLNRYKNNRISLIKLNIKSPTDLYWLVNLDKFFKIEINTFNFVFGRQLIQQDEKKRLYPIAFFSKKLYGLEFNYSIYNKKLIVIIELFKE